MLKKDVMMTMGSFSKKVSHDLKKTLKITLEWILYSGGVKVRKLQLVSKKKFNLYLMLKYIESYVLQRWWVIKVGVWMTHKVWKYACFKETVFWKCMGVLGKIILFDDMGLFIDVLSIWSWLQYSIWWPHIRNIHLSSQ